MRLRLPYRRSAASAGYLVEKCCVVMLWETRELFVANVDPIPLAELPPADHFWYTGFCQGPIQKHGWGYRLEHRQSIRH